MITDYHTHLEYLQYSVESIRQFQRHCDELGISEHSHTFPAFKNLYYDELILDNSTLGVLQSEWVLKNKFKHSIEEFISLCRSAGVLCGLELCNFHNQDAVRDIISRYDFDYIIGSVHFLNGWGFDNSATLFEWENHNLRDLWEIYTLEVERLCYSGNIDILGHPYNLRLFKHIPSFDVSKYLYRAVYAMKANNVAVDVNTGTLYRYPIQEISPFAGFMELAAENGLDITINSDAHRPDDCAKFFLDAVSYCRGFGFSGHLRFKSRCRFFEPFG